jgi:protein-L-isoaspartate(D-aspartate) O-methyltransferase
MVERQIEARGVKDTAVLRVMRQVPRHLFVPVSYAPQAYWDGPLAIGHGQMISQPYIVAFMAEALRLRGDDRVLEIGTGSGYQTAVLAQLARDVFSIEIVKPLAERAAAKLKNLGYANVQVRVGDGYQGWPEHAPYDAILVSAAPDHIPQPLLDQLAVGGRMILPLGKKFSQDLMLIRRTHSGYERTPLLPVAFVPMTGEAQER